jgi:hypothetical protein
MVPKAVKMMAHPPQEQPGVDEARGAMKQVIKPARPLALVEPLEVQRAVPRRDHVEAEDRHQRHEVIGAQGSGDDGRDAHHGHAVEEDLPPQAMPIAALAHDHGERRHHQRHTAGDGMHPQHQRHQALLVHHRTPPTSIERAAGKVTIGAAGSQAFGTSCTYRHIKAFPAMMKRHRHTRQDPSGSSGR